MKWARDLRKPARNKNISKFASSKNNSIIMCESFNELDCCYWLEYASNITSFCSQPETINYFINEKEHRYTADFLAINSLGKNIHLEIKPFNKIHDCEFRNTYEAQREKMRALGSDLILVTEKQLRTSCYLHNCKLIHRYSGLLDGNIQLDQIRREIQLNEKVSATGLASRLKLPPQEVFSGILRLLSLREIGADLFNHELNENSLIWFGESLPIIMNDDFEDTSYLDLGSTQLHDTYQDMRYQKLKKTVVHEPDLAVYPEEQQDLAIERYKLLCLIINDLDGGWTPRNLNPLIDQYISETQLKKPSYKTVIRWHQSFVNSDGKITSLVNKDKKKGNRNPRIVGDEKYFELALERYLDSVRPSISAAYTYYCDLIIIENESIVSGKIPMMSYTSFRLRIKKLPPYEVMFTRYGKYLADREFCFKHKIKMPTRILERVEIDHTPLDLILLDDELLVPLGRAFLTMLVDVYSGCIIGFHLGFQEPSFDSAAKAIIHAVKQKHYVKQLPIEFNNEWICQGKIENLVVDNGAEFLSKSLENACLETGINIIQNQVRKPWMKPFIERKFGEVIQGIVGWIPGKTFSNVLEKSQYNPEKDAVMRFNVFVEEFHRWIIDVHNAKTDTKSKRIPNLFWNNSYTKLSPKLITDEESKTFKITMGLMKHRELTNKGITYHYITYDSEALAEYRKTYPQTKSSKQKKIKIDPDNLASIYVYLEELNGYIEVPSKDPDGYTHNLCLSLHKITIKAHKEYINENIDIYSLAKARLALHERIISENEHLKQIALADRHKKSKGRKKIAKATQINSDTSAMKNSSIDNYPSVKSNENAPIDVDVVSKVSNDPLSLWKQLREEKNKNE